MSRAHLAGIAAVTLGLSAVCSACFLDTSSQSANSVGSALTKIVFVLTLDMRYNANFVVGMRSCVSLIIYGPEGAAALS